ncbi:MAG: aminopeptidase [Pseudoruegeria sp.]
MHNSSLPQDELLVSSRWPDELEALARTAIRVGVNLQPGQELIVTAPVESLPLVRAIARQAYAAGAKQVTPILQDDEVTLARYHSGSAPALDGAPGWLYAGMASAYASNVARLAILGDDPALLSKILPADVARVAKANALAYQPIIGPISKFETNWAIIAYPGAKWAQQIFPNMSKENAVDRLAKEIFSASRVLSQDPVSEWAQHTENLAQRVEYLNKQSFDALHFVGEDTDLKVGLAFGHVWQGGAADTTKGITTVCNMPTEEVFTAPHRDRVDGWARATKPLPLNGGLIEGIRVKFEKGKAVQVLAEQGEEQLNAYLDIDPAGRYLGEVALVPHSSPISQSGVVFQNILFDENASSHLAFGQSYAKCFADARDELLDTRGGNQSTIHLDWMIGSGDMNVYGLDTSGASHQIMRNGEWV